jgi:3-oxoacyl-[acyl-carrier-protein] synthase II
LGRAVMDRPTRRVVVTGMGAISPAGCGLDDYWQGLTCGTSAIRRVTRFCTDELEIHTAGEADIDHLKDQIPKTTMRGLDRYIDLALLASKEALADAGILEAARSGLRVAALIGSGLGPCDAVARSYKSYESRGVRGVRPTGIPRGMFNGIASELSIAFHLTGRHDVTAAACASGALAMSSAYDAIVSGKEDVVLTGGSDSPLTISIYVAWANLRVLSSVEEPAKAMRPFDKRRDGFVLGEGAGMLIFEELEHAKARGAKIYGEFLGYGASSDATHITKPDMQGQSTALLQAIQSSGIVPEDVDYINAHGTATQLNDLTETESLRQVFGPHADNLMVSSTKSTLGHTMGASGALEAIATMLAFKNQTIPPTVNLDVPDPACDLDYVPNEPRQATIRTALSNSFAFGGSNSVIAMRTYED